MDDGNRQWSCPQLSCNFKFDSLKTLYAHTWSTGHKAAPSASALQQQVDKLTSCLARQNEEICQIAGKVLGYPWYKDDPKNFPEASKEDGVCVGEHVAESIVAELAHRYQELKSKQGED